MLKYKLLEQTSDYIKYEYDPEQSGKVGLIIMNMHTGECRVKKESPEDFGKRYAYHLIQRLEEFYRHGEFQESGIIAWY